MSTRVRAALAGVCLIPLAATGTAQCAPYSKSGFSEQKSFGAGQTLDLGRIDRDPTAIRLRFEHHPLAGITLKQIGHRGTRPDGKVGLFEFLAVPPRGMPRGFWQCLLKPVGSDTPVLVSPDHSRAFRLFVDSSRNPRAAIFRWEGVAVAGASPIDWVEVLVRVPSSTPYRSEWSIRMRRRAGSSSADHFTIDEVRLPIVFSIQPGDANKTRLLVPVAQREPIPIANSTMRLWQLLGFQASLEHPSHGQQLQFSALYAGDTASRSLGRDIYSPYRKILYLATEDTVGHYKRFEHGVVTDPLGAGYYGRSVVQYPEYVGSPRDTCYASPYVTVLSALQARNEAYWYDVAAHYRSFVRARMGLQPMRSSSYAGNPDSAGDSVILATSSLPSSLSNLEDVFRTYVDAADDLRAVFRNAETGKPSPVFTEWQKWLLAPTWWPETLLGPDFNPKPFTGASHAAFEPPKAARDQVQRAHKLGINVSVYTLPHLMHRLHWPSFKPSWFRRQRSGQVVGFLSGQHVDLGTPGVRDWLKKQLYSDILSAMPGLGGFYLDTFGGSASYLRYPTQSSDLFRGDFHGGTKVVEDSRKLFGDLRDLIASRKQTRRHPDVPFVPTEIVQEFLVGHFDTAQHGLKPLPLHSQLSTFVESLTRAPIDAVETTTANPPLWNTVYHEYARADALLPMLSVAGVSSQLGGGHPQVPGKPGLNWQEWGDGQRFLAGLHFAQGMKTALLTYIYNIKEHSLLVRRNGTVGVRDPANRRQTQLLQFLQRLHTATNRRAEAGQFLFHGSAERPLTLPPRKDSNLDPRLVTQYRSPSRIAFLKTAPVEGVTRGYYEDPLTQRVEYPVAAVFHSVWRSHPGSSRLGLVMVNWSDAPADWQATFDPRLYDGFSSRFRVVGLRPKGAGVTTFKVADGRGETTLAWSASGSGIRLKHHAASNAGKMPPRSVQVFLIEPR